MGTITRATLEALYRAAGKSDLVGGRIVGVSSGHLPCQVALKIFMSLLAYGKQEGRIGVAYADGIGYAVPELPSGRASSSPDASYFSGPLPANRMRFIEHPPTFAVEVRSENEYGPAAERDMAAKREDYFRAGTLVVWEVDSADEVVAVYRPAAPTAPAIFRRGDVADGEPAVSGWSMPVDQLFSV